MIVLDEKPGGGADILGKLLANAQKAAYAVVLLTGDDEGRVAGSSDWQRRARQNVVLELGLFIGLLGRHKVMALYESGVEIPSDYLGVTYVELDKNKAWRIGLVSELRNAGIDARLLTQRFSYVALATTSNPDENAPCPPRRPEWAGSAPSPSIYPGCC